MDSSLPSGARISGQGVQKRTGSAKPEPTARAAACARRGSGNVPYSLHALSLSEVAPAATGMDGEQEPPANRPKKEAPEHELVVEPLKAQAMKENLWNSEVWKGEEQLEIPTDTSARPMQCDVYLKGKAMGKAKGGISVYIECKLWGENHFSHALGQVLRYEAKHRRRGRACKHAVKIIALNKAPKQSWVREAWGIGEVLIWSPGEKLRGLIARATDPVLLERKLPLSCSEDEQARRSSEDDRSPVPKKQKKKKAVQKLPGSSSEDEGPAFKARKAARAKRGAGRGRGGGGPGAGGRGGAEAAAEERAQEAEDEDDDEKDDPPHRSGQIREMRDIMMSMTNHLAGGPPAKLSWG